MTVVTGPPCAGHAEWIAERAKPGDIIIDLDALITAMGGDSSDPAPAVLRVARAARVAAIRSATACHRDGTSAWVIDTDPPPWLLARYRSGGAEIITVTAPASVLHERARAARRPERIHGVIDDWLAAHERRDAGTGRAW